MAGNNSQDALYRDIARRYAELEGDALRREADAAPILMTPGLDVRVRGRLRARRTARYATGLSLLAACVMLAVILPAALRVFNANKSASSSASSGAELLPITFALPVNLSVTDSKLDHGQSIYYLADTNHDDVVLVMEETDRPVPSAGLTPMDIDGWSAYALETEDYNYLTFRKAGVLYEMTCRAEMATLVSLGKSIL